MSSTLPTGLPALPKSLHGVIVPRSRSESPRDANRAYSAFKNGSSPRNRPNLVVKNGQIRLTDTGRGRPESLDSALAFLRHEMAGLRQMDTVLLGQLCSLNETIQEVKLQLEPDTTSTCSSRSLRSLDHITEGEEYESPFTSQRIYENAPRNGVTTPRTWSLREEEDEEYLEPRDWRGSTGGVSHSTPRWNPPPCLSLELLSLPPPPPLPLSSPPHSPPIPISPEYLPIQRNESRRSSAGSAGSRSSARHRRSESKSSQNSNPEDRRIKWPGYLLNSSTSYESAC